MEREKLLPLVGQSDITVFLKGKQTTTLQKVRVMDVGEKFMYYTNVGTSEIRWETLEGISVVKWDEKVTHEIRERTHDFAKPAAKRG